MQTSLFSRSLVPSVNDVGNYRFRALQRSDDAAKITALLSQLTAAPPIPQSQFESIFDRMVSANSAYFVVICENTRNNEMVGIGTLVVEQKILRRGGKVGHIEDIVVDRAVRGLSIGVRLLATLKSIAQQLGCYKVILNCSQDNIAFYKKCGFHLKEVQMVCRLDGDDGNDGQSNAPKSAL